MYTNVTNVIVRLSCPDADRKCEQSTVLLNSHFDTTLGSPGAADDAVGVAVMLEAIRVLSLEGWEGRKNGAVFCEYEVKEWIVTFAFYIGGGSVKWNYYNGKAMGLHYTYQWFLALFISYLISVSLSLKIFQYLTVLRNLYKTPPTPSSRCTNSKTGTLCPRPYIHHNKIRD